MWLVSQEFVEKAQKEIDEATNRREQQEIKAKVLELANQIELED